MLRTIFQHLNGCFTSMMRNLQPTSLMQSRPRLEHIGTKPALPIHRRIVRSDRPFDTSVCSTAMVRSGFVEKRSPALSLRAGKVARHMRTASGDLSVSRRCRGRSSRGLGCERVRRRVCLCFPRSPITRLFVCLVLR